MKKAPEGAFGDRTDRLKSIGTGLIAAGLSQRLGDEFS